MTDSRYGKNDLAFYEEQIRPWLPERVLDFHTHAWMADQWRAAEGKTVTERSASGDVAKDSHSRYMSTTVQYTGESLLSDGELMFPGRYSAVVFGQPTPAVNVDKTNAYVSAQGKNPSLYPLMVAGTALYPDTEELREKLIGGGFFGYKVYLDWVGDDYGQVRAEEMLSPAQLRLADELGLVVLLHVPGARRLADPAIQRGVMRLASEYPGMRLVLAHCGRCYGFDEMLAARDAFRGFPENVSVDVSMAMDPIVIQMVINAVGPKRMLFATDFPVAAMRGRRVTVMDHWVDLVEPLYSESAYRVMTGNMRSTFMAWEIARATIAAGRVLGLPKADFDGMFHDNGMRLLSGVMEGAPMRAKLSRPR